jgi:effector-binding domain-containing protein
MAINIKDEVEILWWERKLISREGTFYRAYAYYKNTATSAWENSGENLEAVLDNLVQAVEEAGLTVVSINKGK